MKANERAVAFWISAFAGLIALDVKLHRTAQGCTLSEVGRALFKVHHPVGRAVFIGGWTTLSVWLVPHIIRVGEQVVTDAIDAAVESLSEG